MKLIKVGLSLFVLVMLCLPLISCQASKTSEIKFGCIDYAPFTMLDESGTVVGAEADMVRAACDRIGVDPIIEMYDSWEDAYGAALDGPMQATITTAYTPERKDLFKWAGPLNRVPYWLLSVMAQGVDFDTLEEAKQLNAIATINGWDETAQLEELGFKNLVYCDTMQQAIGKAIAGEVQAFAHAIPMKGTVFTDGEQTLSINEIKRHFAYHVAYYYIAFSKDVPDEVVQSYQSGVDQIMLDGTATAIKTKYVQVNLVPYGKIQFFTEINPPFNFVNFGKTEAGKEQDLYLGSSVEIVHAIEAELGVKNPITPPLWSVGYSIVQYLPYSAIFSTVRDAEREDMFQWVGPIATWEPVFCTLNGDGIVLKTLEDLQNHTVATVRDWSDVDTLVKNDIPYIVGDDLDSAFSLFLDKKADVFYIDRLTLAYLVQSNEVTVEDFDTVSFFKGHPMYIAFSKETPAQVVENWQSALDALKDSGKFQAIWNRWYPGAALPQE